MSRERFTWVVVGVMVVVGSVAVAARYYYRKIRPLTEQESTWRLEYDIHLDVDAKDKSEYRVFLPGDTPTIRTYRQQLVHAGSVIKRRRGNRLQGRELVMSPRRRGKQRVRVSVDLHYNPREKGQKKTTTKPAFAAEQRTRLLTNAKDQNLPALVATELSRIQRGDSDRDVANSVFEYCKNQLVAGRADTAAKVLTLKSGSVRGRHRALVALLRGAKIPARTVVGFDLTGLTDPAVSVVWAEAYFDKRWHAFDLASGAAGIVPPHYIAVRRGGDKVVSSTNPGMISNVDYSLTWIPAPAGMRSTAGRHWYEIFDLTRLPLDMHEILSLMLLLPLGALATSVIRTMVGIRTYGTFTPALLSISFVYTDWRSGIVLLAIVLLIGIAGRRVLDRLQLLMVPRLSILLVIVVFCLQLGLSIVDYFGITISSNTVLLPMVILAMLVERFFIATEEDGVGNAVRLLAGTTFVAVCCYLILRWKTVGTLFLAFPELHFFTIAALVFVGRYTGFRLTELRRFSDFTPQAGS